LETASLRVLKLGPLGPYANNAFILIDKTTNASALIDAVPEIDQVLAAAAGTRLELVLFTHSHPDHIASFEALRARTAAPYCMHPAEPWADHTRIDRHLAHGAMVRLGATPLQVIHTPGHTPGGLCFYSPGLCVVGDTLFPGGPGHTTSNANLQTLVASITQRLLPLPEDTVTLNGHGEDCTIGRSKAEYAAFAARSHAPGLHGDVLWGRD
jgi:glyoxylase-like metal-dependent hydrolase (beta-lactamase superfamily II)